MAILKKYQKAYDVLIEGDEYKSVNHIYDRFISEYGWHIERVGRHKALTDWLQGLALDIPFYDWDIMETFDLNEKQTENYWPFMAMRLQELFKKEGLI